MSHIRTETGRRIFYDERGEGTPIVLIPGMTAHRRGYISRLAEALAARHRVITVDNRDAGENDPETDYYTLADVAGDVAALLDGLDLDRAHALGHSLGGAVALRLALDHQTRVDRLVLISTSASREPPHRAGDPLPPPPATWSEDPTERMRQWLPDLTGSAYRARMGPAEADAIADLERGNRATWAGIMRQGASREGPQLAHQLGAVRAPTLVIHGDEDDPEHAQELAEGVPNARLLLLPGVGHLPWVERPEAVVPAILEFLEEPRA